MLLPILISFGYVATQKSACCQQARSEGSGKHVACPKSACITDRGISQCTYETALVWAGMLWMWDLTACLGWAHRDTMGSWRQLRRSQVASSTKFLTALGCDRPVVHERQSSHEHSACGLLCRTFASWASKCTIIVGSNLVLETRQLIL